MTRLVLGLVLVGALAGGSWAGVAGASAQSDTCTGGTIAAGTYNNLDVTGVCSVAAGARVVVHGGVTISGGGAALYVGVTPGQALRPQLANTSIVIKGGVSLTDAGILVLGCQAADGCTNAGDAIDGGITAVDPTAIRVYFTAINGDVSIEGGKSLSKSFGAGQWTSVEDDSINGGLSIDGYTGPFMGVNRDTVHGDVTISNNAIFFTTIANSEIDIRADTIAGSLNCFGNSPTSPASDPDHTPDTVTGAETGQCVGL